ncbi:fimbrial protein [Providencia alcalifaciens]|uniref:fimbrial protein n=1 Tax=Providencia TaxID=586 RepID=UPI0018E7D256|nr:MULTISPECIES: fimbrial protein [Providencia]EJD6083039.1 type 1 fimbrial protein [Providencia rettgeri]EJD6400697.1 type 1 fimbrial protein [Providencia rettgeri]EJD6584537.1 type 1 fimbrial protein [Providencia rettgeri]EJD6601743.1 type 1 fimbrial protein [Providencia rettgeri]EJD6613059.1 type 1 fimbrial protein [Providencia rettgeri]
MNKLNMALIGATCALISSQAAWGAASQIVNFGGEVTEGTCDISIPQGASFTFAKVSIDNLAAGKASEIQDLTTKITCATTNTPVVRISGAFLTGKNMIFRTSSSTSNQYGFMIRPKVAGVTAATFYDEDSAVLNYSSVSHGLTTGGAAAGSTKEWTVGMVRASGNLTPRIGTVEALVTFSAEFK